MASVFKKLSDRIKKDIDWELVDFKRKYVGIHMRASGAFVWVSKIKGTNIEVGSTVTATELLKKIEPLELMENKILSQLFEII